MRRPHDICTLRNLCFIVGPMLGCWLRFLYFDGAGLSMQHSRDIHTLEDLYFVGGPFMHRPRDIRTLGNLCFIGGPMLGCWFRYLYFDRTELSM